MLKKHILIAFPTILSTFTFFLAVTFFANAQSVNLFNGKDLFLRIEVHPDEMQEILEIKEHLDDEGRKRGYKWVTLDLCGYRTGGGTE